MNDHFASGSLVWLMQSTLLLGCFWGAYSILRFHPRARVALCRIVSVALLALPLLALAPVPPILHLSAPSLPDKTINFSASAVIPSPVPDTAIQFPIEPPSVGSKSKDFAHPAVSSFWRSIRPAEALATLWFLGLAFLMARWLLGLKRVWRLVRSTQEPPPWACGIQMDLAAQLNLGTQVRLRVVEDAGSPLLVGPRPVILIPQRLLAEEDQDDLVSSLAHELVHVKELDWWWSQWLQVVAAILWPVAPIWFLRRAHDSAAEIICDSVAAPLVGGKELYVGTLARQSLHALEHPGLATVPMLRRSGMRERIDLLLSGFALPAFSRRLMMMTGLLALLVCGALNGVRVVAAGDAPVSKTPEVEEAPLIITSGYGVSGLVLWLAADSGVTIDSKGKVTCLADRTGNFTLTPKAPSQEPTYISNGPIGRPMLRFNGHQSLYSPDNFGTALNRDMTFITVAMTPFANRQQYPLYLGQNSTPHVNRAYSYIGGKEYFEGQFVGFIGKPVVANAFIVAGASVNSTLTQATFYRNGRQTMIGNFNHVENGDATFGDLSEGVTMGAATDPCCGWQGDIAEELVYDHQLSAAEMQMVWSYLSAKYGIQQTDSLPPSAPVTARVPHTLSGYGVGGVVLWLAADGAMTTDSTGNHVTALTDKTGNFTLTPTGESQEPSYVPNGLNGRPVLRFNGNQSLYSPDDFGTALNRDMTFITVAMTQSATAQQYPLYLGQNCRSHVNRAYSYIRGEEYFEGQFVGFIGKPVVANAFIVAGASVNSTLTQATFYRNGRQTMIGNFNHAENGDATFGDLSEGVTMGAATGPFCGWQGDIAEELVYDHQLSGAEMQMVWGCLSDKYGIRQTDSAPSSAR